MLADLSKSSAHGSNPSAFQTGPSLFGLPPAGQVQSASDWSPALLHMLQTQHLHELTDIVMVWRVPVCTASSDRLLQLLISWTSHPQLREIVETERDVERHLAPLRKVFRQAACCSLRRPLARPPPTQQQQQEEAPQRSRWSWVWPSLTLLVVTMEQW